MTTPLMIEIAIHYYTRASTAGDYGASEGRTHAPAVVEQSRELCEAGLLRETTAGAERAYEATEGCKVWLDALCALPLPIQQWTIPRSQAAGGHARALALSPERRTAIARDAAKARWAT